MAGSRRFWLSTSVTVACETEKREVKRSGEPQSAGGSILVPSDEVVTGVCADHFFAVPREAAWPSQLEIFDYMFRRLRNHPAAIIKSLRPARPPI